MIRTLSILLFLVPLYTCMAQNSPEDLEPWWESFDNGELSALVEQGLANNPDPVVALARMKSADMERRGISSERLPMLNLQAAYRSGRENTVKTGFVPDDIDPLAAEARLSWELDVFDRVGQAIDAGDARTESAFQTLRGVRLSLSLDIATAVLEVIYLDEMEGLLNNQLQSAQFIANQTERRLDAGWSDAPALDLAEALTEKMKHVRMELALRLDIARTRLKYLLGGDPSSPLPPSSDAVALPAMPDSLQEYEEIARPDLARAWADVQAAQAVARSADRSRLPRLSLVVSAAGEREVSGDSEEWSAWAGPMLDLPLWEPNRKWKAQREKAKAEAAQAQFESISLLAVREIDTAWVNRSSAVAMKAHMEYRYQRFKEVSESQTRKLNAGLIRDELLQRAKIEEVDAFLNFLQGEWDAKQSHLQLIRALGGKL